MAHVDSDTYKKSEEVNSGGGNQRPLVANQIQIARPNWQKDESSASCTACHQIFTTFRRRHHCRACGKLFCARCTAGKMELPYLGYEGPQRVCNDCLKKGTRSFPCPFETLPRSVAIRIFEYLDVYHLARVVPLVCRKWTKLSGDLRLWSIKYCQRWNVNLALADGLSLPWKDMYRENELKERPVTRSNAAKQSIASAASSTSLNVVAGSVGTMRQPSPGGGKSPRGAALTKQNTTTDLDTPFINNPNQQNNSNTNSNEKHSGHSPGKNLLLAKGLQLKHTLETQGAQIVLLGVSESGKSALVQRFHLETFLNIPHDPTNGVSFITKNMSLGNNRLVKLSVWDTAGAPKFRQILTPYYQKANAIVLCYDITSEKSFLAMTEWRETLKRSKDCGDVLIALCGTKLDRAQTARRITEERAKEYQSREGLDLFLETSSKTGENVLALFRKLSESLMLRAQLVSHHQKAQILPPAPTIATIASAASSASSTTSVSSSLSIVPQPNAN